MNHNYSYSYNAWYSYYDSISKIVHLNIYIIFAQNYDKGIFAFIKEGYRPRSVSNLYGGGLVSKDSINSGLSAELLIINDSNGGISFGNQAGSGTTMRVVYASVTYCVV